MSKVSICLWFGKDVELAVRFYVSPVPGSSLRLHPALARSMARRGSRRCDLGSLHSWRSELPSVERRCASQLRDCRLHLSRVRRPSGGRSAVDGAHRRWWVGNHVRLVARQVGRSLANRARSSAASLRRFRPGRLGPGLCRYAEHGQAGYRHAGACRHRMMPARDDASGLLARADVTPTWQTATGGRFRPLDRLPGAPAARPCPLEVVAAQPARDIGGFPDHEQARHGGGLHGF